MADFLLYGIVGIPRFNLKSEMVYYITFLTKLLMEPNPS